MEKEIKISPEAAKEVRTRIEDKIHKHSLPGHIPFAQLILQQIITKEEFATIVAIWKGEIDITTMDKMNDIAYIITQRNLKQQSS